MQGMTTYEIVEDSEEGIVNLLWSERRHGGGQPASLRQP